MSLDTRFCHPFAVSMKAAAKRGDKPGFQKVNGIPCLYRYSSNAGYYALAEHEGKQKESL